MRKAGDVMKAACSFLVLALCLLLSSCAPAGFQDRREVAAKKPGDTLIRPTDGMQIVFVPAGEFVMGSDREMIAYARKLCSGAAGKFAAATCKGAAFADEGPAHPVRLHSFWIDKTEVTNAQYRACVEEGSCAPPYQSSSFTRQSYYGDPAYDTYPVVNVDWQMAAEYCVQRKARLPTESEWEYAARGPQNLLFPWGEEFDPARLNYCDRNCAGLADAGYNDGYPDTAPAGSFPDGASWIGALDMAGNVREWVSDWYGPYSHEEVEGPGGPGTGDSKIPRGGSWYDTPDDVRSANRGSELPDYFRHNLGFRCAQDAE